MTCLKLSPNLRHISKAVTAGGPTPLGSPNPSHTVPRPMARLGSPLDSGPVAKEDHAATARDRALGELDAAMAALKKIRDSTGSHCL